MISTTLEGGIAMNKFGLPSRLPDGKVNPEYRRAWKEANPDKVRQYHREYHGSYLGKQTARRYNLKRNATHSPLSDTVRCITCRQDFFLADAVAKDFLFVGERGTYVVCNDCREDVDRKEEV
jgi:hypothetical protein